MGVLLTMRLLWALAAVLLVPPPLHALAAGRPTAALAERGPVV